MVEAKAALRNVVVSVVISVFIVSISGCASIVQSAHQTVKINSDPSGASLKIYDIEGQQIFSEQTPFVATLKRGRGYFKGSEYKLVIEKNGYKTKEIQISSRVGGWYAFGNLLFGGLIGYLIVDPMTGGMWTLTPTEVNTSLTASSTLSRQKTQEGLVVVLKKDVPDDLLEKMKPVEAKAVSQ